MRILVTGHLGYIGTVLTPMLTEEGFDVVGLDSDLYRGCTFGAPSVNGTIESRIGDIRDVERQDLSYFDAIIHLAALSNDPLGDLDPQLTEAINYAATVRLAELSRQVGVERFVFSSSCSNYGAGGEELLDEDAPLDPLTPYGLSKVRAEQELAKLADDNFSPVFLRNATAYGLSPRLRFDLVVNNLTAWAFTTGHVLLTSDGSAWRPLVHVADICRAFVAALRAPREKIHNEVFNVGGTQESYRVRALAEVVAETVPDSAVKFAEGVEADQRCYRVNCDKITETLGFQLDWDVRRGTQQVYAGYRDVHLTSDQLESPHYHRVGRIEQLLELGVLDSNLRYQARPQIARRA